MFIVWERVRKNCKGNDFFYFVPITLCSFLFKVLRFFSYCFSIHIISFLSFTLIILTSFLRLVIFLYLFVSLCLPQNITLHFWYLFCNVVVVFFLQLLIVRRGQKDTEMCFSCFQCCCYFFFWLISTYFLCCFCKKKIKSCWT